MHTAPGSWNAGANQACTVLRPDPPPFSVLQIASAHCWAATERLLHTRHVLSCALTVFSFTLQATGADWWSAGESPAASTDRASCATREHQQRSRSGAHGSPLCNRFQHVTQGWFENDCPDKNLAVAGVGSGMLSISMCLPISPLKLVLQTARCQLGEDIFWDSR